MRCWTIDFNLPACIVQISYSLLSCNLFSWITKWVISNEQVCVRGSAPPGLRTCYLTTAATISIRSLRYYESKYYIQAVQNPYLYTVLPFISDIWPLPIFFILSFFIFPYAVFSNNRLSNYFLIQFVLNDFNFKHVFLCSKYVK